MDTTRNLLAAAACALVLAGCGTDTDQPADEAGPARSSGPSSTPSGAPSSAPTLDVAGLPTGAPPAVPYAVDPHPVFGDGHFSVVRPDGTRQRLPRGPMGDFVAYERNVVRSYGTEGGAVVEVIDADGRVTERHDGLTGYGLAATPDTGIVGWLDDDGAFQVREDGATRALSLAPVEGATGAFAGAISGSGTCKEQAPEGGGCTAFVDDADDAGARLTSSHGIVDVVPGIDRVVDVDQRGRLLGLLDKKGGCWGVLQPNGREAWRTCDHELTGFSPDGRHVLGVDGKAERVRGLVVHDRAGAVAAQWTWDGGADRRIEQLAWEDAGHVLAVVVDRGEWSIVRVGLDGSTEYAVAPVRRGPDFSPFRLPLT